MSAGFKSDGPVGIIDSLIRFLEILRINECQLLIRIGILRVCLDCIFQDVNRLWKILLLYQQSRRRARRVADWPGSTFSTLRYASSARSVSPFSSSDIPSTKCVSASALCAPSERSDRSAAGLELSESSWRSAFFIVADEDRVLGGERFRRSVGRRARRDQKDKRQKKTTAQQNAPCFFRCLTRLMLVFGLTSANQPLKLLGLWPGRQSLFELGVGRPALDVGRFPNSCASRATPYIGDASCADSPSCVCGAYAWQFSLCVFS